MLLVSQNEQDIQDALEAWDWMDFSNKSPIITTCFGDVFFESSDGIYFLDSIGGTLERVAENREKLQQILSTEEGQDHYLMAGLVDAATDSGIKLGPGECYDFKVSPALSGPIELANIQVMSFKVSLHISGQLMKQIKDLPPGSVITNVKLEDA